MEGRARDKRKVEVNTPGETGGILFRWNETTDGEKSLFNTGGQVYWGGGSNGLPTPQKGCPPTGNTYTSGH